jgi:N-acetylmuramoyl-L-alanine amidase
MILTALAAFQLAATLVVRDAHRVVRVPLVSTATGPMVRPEAFGDLLPVGVHHDSASAYTLDIFGAHLQLDVGASTVRVGEEVRQLATPPILRNGHLFVPLQLISEVFPALVPNTRWDAEAGQLIVFTSAVSAGDVSAPAALVRADVTRARDDVAPSRPSPVTSSASGTAPARTDDSRLPPVPVKHGGRRTIIVDAGHGGVDNGMTGPLGRGPRIYEKDITLAVANKLGAQLKARGVDVVYTRTADTLIALDDRGRIANRAGGALFISIHVNAANPNWKDPGGSRGFETYFLSEAKTEDARRVEQMENSVVRLETTAKAGRGDALSFILNDMTQNQHLRESSQLAELIQERLGTMHPGPSRGVKQAGFRVLVTAYMPAVLVEIGFGTNPREAAYMTEPAKQDALAKAIADAAMEYLQSYEGRLAGGGPSR